MNNRKGIFITTVEKDELKKVPIKESQFIIPKNKLFWAFFNKKGYPKSNKYKQKIEAENKKEAITKANHMITGTCYSLRQVKEATT